MSIQIRKNVFETNSSSSHSLVIHRGESFELGFTSAEITSGRVVLPIESSYGIDDHVTYETVKDKLAYFIGYYLYKAENGFCVAERESVDEVTQELCDDIPQIKELLSAFKARTGVESIVLQFQYWTTVDFDYHNLTEIPEIVEDVEKVNQVIYSDSYIQVHPDYFELVNGRLVYADDRDDY